MTNEGEVYFTFWGGDFDPDEISMLMNIEPTKIYKKGTPISGEPTPTHSKWILSGGIVKNDFINIYKMSSILISRLEPLEEKIAAIMKKYKLKASLQVNIDFAPHKMVGFENIDGAEIGFEPEVVRFLSNVGASIDVDVCYE
jgi:hypothetical protein